ncbi:MAG: SH3 domain-containing protein [Spirochaetales bacterium]|jgi:cytochrome b|nr:SH3 domain-containing protein [Spirochaetales bacterium]
MKRLIFTGFAPVFVLIVCAVFAAGCRRDEPLAGLQMPTTPVLAIRANWGIVASPYLRVRSKPQPNAEVVAHLRNASIVEILARTSYPENVEGKSDYWYEIACDGIRGWVFGSYLEFHNSREDAERASQESAPNPPA